MSGDTTAGDSTVRIGLILPDVLGTYGDGGNAVVLRERLRMRGYRAEIVATGFGEPVPDSLDIYALGGGEDAAQRLAARHMTAHPGLQNAAHRGAPVLAVCAGLQVMGEWFTASDGPGGALRRVDGLGLLDATTEPGRPEAGGRVSRALVARGLVTPRHAPGRIIGEVAASPLVDGLTATLTGFENHGGNTTLGPAARPLGRVVRGTGNKRASDPEGPAADETLFEGAVQGSLVATYMHGPVLARNPELADLLIARALGVAPGDLAPLEMPDVEQLRTERLASR
ncbi:type 1 glutamine amidotransferase [Tomitella fengzijianii]|uniref:Lipid II isoglutaminyl synthase (glutamine-hydrolyzing) subunit GatD n=1 Tax=Tomitella fengzijianii TaxID=2597660 RepID=A0A516X034_9ACTN|nr:glutamine amidotransferase [Tomitella fengzijianii]QDQ96423.1 glutamine amidotransferase [Tomitella fengzijianii]